MVIGDRIRAERAIGVQRDGGRVVRIEQKQGNCGGKKQQKIAERVGSVEGEEAGDY